MEEPLRTPTRPRRDFVVTAALGFVGAGALIATWPFIAQLLPDAATTPPETTDVDLAPLQPGQSITVSWRDKPVIIRRRTTREIELSRAVPLAVLRDRIARNEALPPEANALDINRTLKDRPEWLLVIGVCPRDGCKLLAQISSGEAADDAFTCPCDNSRFDIAGRVRSGLAPTNLIVPPYRFVTPATLRIG